MSDRDFIDPITGATCTVVDTPDGWLPHGIQHPGCDGLADPCPDLDAFFCPECGHNGRVSGADHRRGDVDGPLPGLRIGLDMAADQTCGAAHHLRRV